MFSKVLIANRGEIAVRIIRACHEMGIKTVAVYSQADAEALHVLLADEAVCIGPGPAKESYLSIANIVSAAAITGAEAIHPGYGFLAENSSFAEVCEQVKIKFIGPPPAVIDAMGNKASARDMMRAANVPIIPGTSAIRDEREAQDAAKEMGYPLIIKASAGGGGKGNARGQGTRTNSSVLWPRRAPYAEARVSAKRSQYSRSILSSHATSKCKFWRRARRSDSSGRAAIAVCMTARHQKC
jgi:acetyl/propionyl-CoA carboxylase alpha subunit